MDLSKHISSGNLHHAYLIEGGADTFSKLRTFVEKMFGENVAGNPDAHVREFETLGIDEARELTARALKKALGKRKMFLCHAGAITREAQNSLLKLLEEPPKDTHFFICTPSVTHILPTLHSRVWLIDNEREGGKESHIQADMFLKASHAKRLEMIAPLAKEKDIAGAQALLENVEKELYKRGDLTKVQTALPHLYEAKSLMRDRGSSLKQLLESVALTTPQA